MSEDISKQSETPVECLMYAVQNLLSGCIEVSDLREDIGQIVVSDGRIAWATCRGQSETLGVFLWRFGRISREQLSHVQQLFKQYKGTKKLGAILEEAGFMNRPLLRRCLLLHTRSAIERLLSYPNARAVWNAGHHAADEAILFGPEEVLPEDFSLDIVSEWTIPDNTWVRGWRRRTSDNAILESLYSLPGHLASAVITADGEIVTAYAGDDSIDLHLVAVFVAGMLESSSRVVSVTSLSSVDLISLECNKGALYIRWLDEKRTRLIFILVNNQGNPYLTRYSINLSASMILEWMVKGGQVGTKVLTSAPEPPAEKKTVVRDVNTLIRESKRMSLSDIFPVVLNGDLNTVVSANDPHAINTSTKPVKEPEGGGKNS